MTEAYNSVRSRSHSPLPCGGRTSEKGAPTLETFPPSLWKSTSMRKSRVKAKLRQKQPVLLTTLHIPDPQLFELTSLLGFDGIWLDLEHHGFTEETAANLTRATRVGSSDIMIR